MDTQSFIKKYEDLAVKDSLKSGVPASITMAQAILEGNHGNSMLFQVANNTFGIKCGGGWQGDSVRANDDRVGECFRKYDSVQDSFSDHSKFLKDNSRYDFLFELPRYDYKSWAYGLKKAGYATAQNYAPALIDLIEKLDLTRLDRKVRFKRFFRSLLFPAIIIFAVIVSILIYYRYKKSNLKIAA